MPSSTPERQDRWHSDGYAMAFLKRHGYVSNRDWTWSAPKGHEPTWLEKDAIIYLNEEWGFGGLLTEGEASRWPMTRGDEYA